MLGDDINSIFCRRFSSLTVEEEACWESLEEEIKGKTGQHLVKFLFSKTEVTCNHIFTTFDYFVSSMCMRPFRWPN